MVSVSRDTVESSDILVVVADNGESIEKPSLGRGARAALAVSLYTKGGVAGNWPPEPSPTGGATPSNARGCGKNRAVGERGRQMHLLTIAVIPDGGGKADPRVTPTPRAAAIR